MSNVKTNREESTLVLHGGAHSNPGIALASDFEVGSHSTLSGHGQHGDTEAEYKSLLGEHATNIDTTAESRPRVEDAHRPRSKPPGRSRVWATWRSVEKAPKNPAVR